MENFEVFLGGTCNGSQWREDLKPLLETFYFDPVVKDWNEEAQKLEIQKRSTCDIVLYVLTPKMTGFYSVAEVTDDSNKRPDKTVLVILDSDSNDEEFNRHQTKSLEALKSLVSKNGAKVCESLQEAAEFINAESKRIKYFAFTTTLLKADVLNGNDRIYTKESLEIAVDQFKKREFPMMGQLGHSDSQDIDLKKVSHKIVDVFIDGDELKANIMLLETPSGKKVYDMLLNGKLVARPKSAGIVNEKKEVQIKKIFSYDLIPVEEDSYKGILEPIVVTQHESI